MSKLLVSLLIAVIVLSTNGFANTYANTDNQRLNLNLELTIKSAKSTAGEFHYQVFNCSDDDRVQWQDLTPLITQRLAPQAQPIKQSLKLTASDYCIRVFQDSNGNGLLDFGSSGIPREPVGFSTNPSLMLGYPVPATTLFRIEDDTAIVIKMNYPRHLKRKDRGAN